MANWTKRKEEDTMILVKKSTRQKLRNLQALLVLLGRAKTFNDILDELLDERTERVRRELEKR